MLDLHCLNPQRYPFLLESGSSGPQGQFDILFACPSDYLALTALDQEDFLSQLDAAWSQECSSDTGQASGLPFRGGWFLYLSYELAGQIEPQLILKTEPDGLPIASATRVHAAVIHDHVNGQRHLVAENAEMMASLESDVRALEETAAIRSAKPAVSLLEEAGNRYLDAVKRIKHYIREGDVFQVNLSRLWQGDWPENCEPADLYRWLRDENPGPFNGLACWGNNAILSSSPERLVTVRDGRVQTRPIAGTRPRGDSPE
ncbi:MAG: chorismate-binding protein, partial [bacterium]